MLYRNIFENFCSSFFFEILMDGWFGKFKQSFYQSTHGRLGMDEQKTMDAYPAGNYMLKVNNRHTRIRSEICSKLTIKTPERCLADNNKVQERTLSVLDINILFFAKRVRKTELKLSQCRCQCQSRFQCLHRGTNVEISK